MTQQKFNQFHRSNLNKDPHESKLLFSGIVGSVLYGTDHKNSDIDIKGVFIPPKEFILGFLRKLEQLNKKNSEDDTVFYTLKKFLNLACDCNPTIIEMLFIPYNYSYERTWEWDKIVDNRSLFLSRKAKHAFTGYAVSQLNRIKTHRNYLLNPPKRKPKRSDFGLADHKTHITPDELGAFNKFIANFLEEIREYHSLKDQLLELEETHNFNTIMQKTNLDDPQIIKTFAPHLDDSFVDIVSKEKRYRKSLNEWNKYVKWKETRNKDRAKLEEKFGYDTKHAAHIVRLLYEGEELLQKGHITLPRPEAGHLKEILNGKWSYEKLVQEVSDFDRYFEHLYNSSPLPREPKRKKVDELCIELIENNL